MPDVEGSASWLIRDFTDRDLDQAVRLWSASQAASLLDERGPGGGRCEPESPRSWLSRMTHWSVHASVDLDVLVSVSSLFTPADIRYAAQASFERALERKTGQPAQAADFLAAIANTRASVTKAMLRDLEEDIDAYARY